MQDLFTLGEHYVSDFIQEGQENRAGKHDLAVVLTDDGRVRLKTTVPVNNMFGTYYYRSGLNATMRAELKDVVNSITKLYMPPEACLQTGVWVDIASNDGTLLSNVPEPYIRIGIDPCEDSYLREAKNHAECIVQDYFSAEAYYKSGYVENTATVITCCAMFYDLEYPDVFLQDINKVLHKDGLFVIQISWTATMLTGLQFDNILSEHVYYYTLTTLKSLLEKNGFKILDCVLNSCNGGSFRVYIMKQSGNEKLFSCQIDRDMGQARVNSILEYEQKLKLDQVETWKKFKSDIDLLKDKTVSFIRKVKSEGKTVWALGASTKGNSMLQFFGLTAADIDGIAERNIKKVGLQTVGSNIKIYSEEDFRLASPDYTLVLIWPFIAELLEREKEYLQNGGKFIVPCPQFEIIGE